jgi:subtilase family serine protease
MSRSPSRCSSRWRPDAPPLASDEHWDATPPAERQYITEEEFATRYGAAQSDLDAVAAFGAKHHLRVLESNSSQRLVILSGKVPDVNEAFGVELCHYEVQGAPEEAPIQGAAHAEPESRRYRGYEGPVHLPPKLTPVVEGVFGLDARRLARRAGVPTVTTPLTPPGVSELYDFPATGHHIRHETIGLLEFSDPVIGKCGYMLSDIDDYFTTTLGIGPGYITPHLTDIGVNGATNSPGGPADEEVALDIEVAGSVAQGAPISVYFTTWDEMGWILAVKRAVHPPRRASSVCSVDQLGLAGARHHRKRDLEPGGDCRGQRDLPGGSDVRDDGARRLG